MARKATNKTKTLDKPKPLDRIFTASLYPPDPKVLPPPIGVLVEALEKELQMPVCLFIQGDEPESLAELGRPVWNMFLSCEDDLPKGKPIALLIDSPGGYAKVAYQIARLLKERCGSFVAIIPRYAKSAATLLVLGASKIYMGKHAELGPLDAQTYDPEREHIISALDTVHSLERVRAFALESIDEAMFLMIGRTRKKAQTVLPHILHFVAELMNPLLQQIDIVEYTQMSRALKVAEEYAVRLLTDLMDQDDAQEIARHFVEHYKEHAFFISPQEARAIGLPIQKNTPIVDEVLHTLYHAIKGKSLTAYGLVQEKRTQ